MLRECTPIWVVFARAHSLFCEEVFGFFPFTRLLDTSVPGAPEGMFLLDTSPRFFLTSSLLFLFETDFLTPTRLP